MGFFGKKKNDKTKGTLFIPGEEEGLKTPKAAVPVLTNTASVQNIQTTTPPNQQAQGSLPTTPTPKEPQGTTAKSIPSPTLPQMPATTSAPPPATPTTPLNKLNETDPALKAQGIRAVSLEKFAAPPQDIDRASSLRQAAGYSPRTNKEKAEEGAKQLQKPHRGIFGFRGFGSAVKAKDKEKTALAKQEAAPKEAGKKEVLTRPKKMTPEQVAAEKVFQQGMASVMDLIAPAAFNVTPNYLELSGYYLRTLFVVTYPQYVQSNWLSPVINYDITLDISMFIHPLESQTVAGQLRRRAAQLESSLTIEEEKGLVRNPELETAIQNIEGLRDALQKGDVRLFQFGLYFTVYAKTIDELNTLTKQLESTLGGMLIYTRQSLLQMEQGFNTTIPLYDDALGVTRNLDTGSLSTTFPFVSMTLSSNEGVLYGINLHNSSLILYDRYKLENANSVIFAKSGAGKSYAVKLEALRTLMLGADVIVIDPENEYKMLTEAVGGTYINVSLNSDVRINPFDLPEPTEGAEGEDTLRSAITMLHGLVALMVGKLSPEEDSLLDKALYETYAMKDITTDPSTQQNPPPLLTDLQAVLGNMTGAESLMQKLMKYTEGTFAGLFTKLTNIDLKTGFVTFSIRDLEEELRPIAMYTILNYIWTRIKSVMKKRMLIVDEAWLLMQYEDSARFVYALAKRARKYYLAMTVISQDVEDFLDSKYGRAVVTSSSMQVLLKQQKIAAQKLADIFGLTEGEKIWLMECEVGQGLFFAGNNHVAIEVVASYNEDQIITTDPQQLLQMREMGQLGEEGEGEENV